MGIPWWLGCSTSISVVLGSIHGQKTKNLQITQHAKKKKKKNPTPQYLSFTEAFGRCTKKNSWALVFHLIFCLFFFFFFAFCSVFLFSCYFQSFLAFFFLTASLKIVYYFCLFKILLAITIIYYFSKCYKNISNSLRK